MTTDHRPGPTLTTGERDTQLNDRLTEELVAFNTAATGETDRGTLSVKVTDEAGELVGGLAAWTWGGLCGIELLWVREDSRKDGWGSRILQAAETEARRRGCDRITVSSFTFQAPGFYQRHGYTETGRTLGIPGGHADVHLFKSLTDPTHRTAWGLSGGLRPWGRSMINLQVRSENGRVEARSEHGVAWGAELAALDQSVFPMLGHLLPYADTVFNSRQVATLLEELSRLPQGVVTQEFTRELLDLGQMVLDGQHLYLWFLGD